MAYTQRIVIDFDRVYHSNSCGDFKIIEDLGRDERSRLFVKIKFLSTGTEKVVRYDIAIDGRVYDELYGIDFNKIYQSCYYGPYQIIEYKGRISTPSDKSRKVVRIRFLNTGYEYDIWLRQAISGFVKDYSIKYEDRTFAEVKDKLERDKIIIKILRFRWRGMMSRCYDVRCQSYELYGAKGVTVCEEWQDFKKFLVSIQSVPNFIKFYRDPQNYFLDKDYLQSNVPVGERVYSPQTCIFLTMYDNSILPYIQSNANIKLRKETTDIK